MWCCIHQNARRIYPVQIYNCYTTLDSQKLKVQRFVKFQQSKNPFEFQNNSRIKIRSKNLQNIFMDLRNSRTNFVDDDFNHVYFNISRDQNDNHQIQWKRVKDLVKNAVYSLPNKNKSTQENFKSNNKALETSLRLILRTHPQKLQNIRNNKLNQQGVYQFKMYKDGIIHNVVIDDYVPSFKGVQIFTGPVNGVQVYPMLLQKAIAKINSGYSQIPQNPIEIMQMLYCGAIIRQKLDDLKNIQQFKQFVMKTLSREGLTILIAKNDKKIRQYGINTSEIYQILNYYEVTYNNQSHVLYEILSENRLSSWNGVFRITDPLWKQIDPKTKDNIFQNMKNNRSFIILDKQMHRVFDNLIVFQDTQRSNKDWLQYYSQNGSPSFCKFRIKEKDDIFLRVLTKEKIRQNLIICRVVGQNQFEYVDGCFNDNCQFLQFHIQLTPGQYVICVIQDWKAKTKGQYVIYLSSTTRAVLTSDGCYFPNFLQQTFINDSQRHNQNLQSVYYRAIKQIGIGYLRVFVKEPQKIKKFTINKKKIESQEWAIMEPYSDMKQIVTTSSIILILKLLTNKPKQLITFPIEAFNFS